MGKCRAQGFLLMGSVTSGMEKSQLALPTHTRARAGHTGAPCARPGRAPFPVPHDPVHPRAPHPWPPMGLSMSVPPSLVSPSIVERDYVRGEMEPAGNPPIWSGRYSTWAATRDASVHLPAGGQIIPGRNETQEREGPDSEKSGWGVWRASGEKLVAVHRSRWTTTTRPPR